MSPRGSKEHIVILLRHGESAWNNENKFCGWVDVGLSNRGDTEAVLAAEALLESGLNISKVFTSLLTRANFTVSRILEKLPLPEEKIVRDWRLNERHYGALTGLNKAECVQEYGSKQVQIWRRSYDIRPPSMESSHPFHNIIASQESCKGVNNIPTTESLKDLIEQRTVPFWIQEVEPLIHAGEKILCVAHGTSLRGIVKHLEDLTPEEICGRDLPNGIPMVYRLDENLRAKCPPQFLADPERVKKAVARVNNIGPKK